MPYGGHRITRTNFFVAFSLLLFGANFDMEDIFYKILPLFITLNLIKIASFIFAQVLVMSTYKNICSLCFFFLGLNFVKMACPHGPCLSASHVYCPSLGPHQSKRIFYVCAFADLTTFTTARIERRSLSKGSYM